MTLSDGCCHSSSSGGGRVILGAGRSRFANSEEIFFQINVNRHAGALQAEHYKDSQEIFLFFFFLNNLIADEAKVLCLLLFSCDSLQQR